MGSLRLSGRLVGSLAVGWLALELGLAALGYPARGPCGGPAPFTDAAQWASAAGLAALVIAVIGRGRATPAQAIPILAGALMVGLCVEALVLPFSHCARYLGPPPWWSGWHRWLVLAFAAALALAGARSRPPLPCRGARGCGKITRGWSCVGRSRSRRC